MTGIGVKLIKHALINSRVCKMNGIYRYSFFYYCCNLFNTVIRDLLRLSESLVAWYHTFCES